MTTQTFWRDRRQYRRTFTGAGLSRRALVESEHPECGWLTRGTIRRVGLDGFHLIWALADYDHRELPPVTGDYVDAEKALLAATTELEN